MKKIFFIFLIVIVVLTGFVIFKKNIINPTTNKIIACTMEAKLCPDGIAVGRIGSNCEFAACPEIKTTSTLNEITLEKK